MTQSLRYAVPIMLCSLAFATPSYSGFDIELDDNSKISFGGYAKFDARYVDGDVPYQDYWLGNFPGGTATDTSTTEFNVRESRINIKYMRDGVTAFVEMDFYGGGGNQVVSNSSNPRLRHFFVKTENWLFGQTWSTFMPVYTLPEAIDFGGPHVGEVFIRQPMIRYTNGGFQIALENPETNGDGNVGAASSAVGLSGDQTDPEESVVDIAANYTFKADWGQVSAAGLLRQVDQSGIDEFAASLNLSGKVLIGDDDIRVSVTVGEPGRYVGPALTPDIVVDPDSGETVVEETTAYTLAYRHLWTEKTRSSIYIGQAETDTLKRDRTHWGINLLSEVKPKLTLGVEVGQFRIDDDGIDSISSDYLQFSAKYGL